MTNQIEDILIWIEKLNHEIYVDIRKDQLQNSDTWYYDEKDGEIRNSSHSFFQIKGLQKIENNHITLEQPIIIQKEIGYLGIICRKIKGTLYFLMQAKIEPGNINKIQISPTIQATKSNCTQQHGGKKPHYLEYFLNASKYNIIVDQIQSEQSSRFYNKRNRNMIIQVDEDIEVLPNFRWMTLYQIKNLMKIDNLVNMDTRTVLSCIPFFNVENDELQQQYLDMIRDQSLVQSIRGEKNNNVIPQIYNYINTYKMYNEAEYRLVPLYSLKTWHMKEGEFVCTNPYSFKVVFCNIEIDGREVKKWTQPLFEATGIATFGLITCVDHGMKKFLVKAISEVGCLDQIEIGPSIQREYIHSKENDSVDCLFDCHLQEGKGILFDTLLSEEGGEILL